MKRITLALLIIGFLIATTAAYHLLRSEWVSYRQAEGSFADGDYSRAALLYRKASDAGLTTPDLYVRLVYSLLMSGQPEKAASLYEERVRRQPGRLADIVLIADGFSRAGRFAEAQEIYLSAIGSHPEVPSLRIFLARTMVRAGRFEEAVTEYKQVLGESP
jgi:tetratricopeptide (TPR) repeat protein